MVHRGLYLDHTGPPTPPQRAWIGVLALWPAALTRESVVRGVQADRPIQVAVDGRRSVRPPEGIVVHRTAHLDARVRWNASPPTVTLEHAVLDLASEAVGAGDVARAFGLLADVCQSRRTTASRLRATLAGRRKVPGRTVLEALLDDLASGACSVLEREWQRLEREHGLPNAERQRHHRSAGRSTYHDVAYVAFGFGVELDGRAFHDSAGARDRDAARDLVTAVEDDTVTVRLTHGQVFRDGCLTVAQVGRLLQVRGWAGVVRRCPRCP